MNADTEFREFVESLELGDPEALADLWVFWDVLTPDGRTRMWALMADRSPQMRLMVLGASVRGAMEAGLIPEREGDETAVMH